MLRWSFFVTFASMIQKLPLYEDSKAYYDEPLLEYALKTTNHFWKYYRRKRRCFDGSQVIKDFCIRYNENEIKKLPTIKKAYLETAEIQETLKAYDLDVDKFWYLCIMAKDYAEGQTLVASVKNPTHREEIQMLISKLEKLSPNKSYIDKICRHEPYTLKSKPVFTNNIIKTVLDGKLTLKIDKDKTLTISDGQTLVIIREALSVFLRHMPKSNNSYLDSAPPFPFNAKQLGIQYRVALFYKYMMWFLNQFTPSPNSIVSTDKRLLISRLIYILNIDNDPRYFDRDELHTIAGKIVFLKNKIKLIKDLEFPVQNQYYKVQDD